MQVEELDSPKGHLATTTPPPNYGQATALPPRPRFAMRPPPLPPRPPPAPELDETTRQQLQAVFAACDDGHGLDAPQTRAAVRALGLGGDAEATVERFRAARGGAPFLSCDAFCAAAAVELDRACGAEPELLKLLALFDGGDGMLDRETLRHLLCDFTSPERLTAEEFDEFARSAGLGDRVDYRAYVRGIMK